VLIGLGFGAPVAAQDAYYRFEQLVVPLVQLHQQTEAGARQREALERQRRQIEARRRAQERSSQKWPEVTEAFSRMIRLGRNGTFDLQNAAGDIVITGGGGSEVRLGAMKRARHQIEAQARAALQELRINATERGGNVEIRTQQPLRRAVWTAVDYVVNLPSGANVIVGTTSGNVRVTNVDGELRARAVGGNVTASDVGHVREISTVGGDVEITNAQADELSAETLYGEVLLRNLKGRVLNLTTVTGDARLIDVEMDRATLQSMGGDLEYAGRLARSGRYEFQTHSGNIRVSPTGNPGFDLLASTFRGTLRSDYALKLLENMLPGPQRRSLRGTFGDAAAVLTAHSFNGDILIVRR
jgi:hypothetical protein